MERGFSVTRENGAQKGIGRGRAFSFLHFVLGEDGERYGIYHLKERGLHAKSNEAPREVLSL